MPVVAISIKAVNAVKHSEAIGNLRISNDVAIKEISEQKLPAINKDGLAIDFEFKSSYLTGKDICAHITVNGNLFYLGNDCEKIAKAWKKDKNIDKTFNIEIVNSVLRKCLVKAVGLADDLNLPAPIQMPFAVDGKEK